jgi:HD-like signal output (HDOD) protein
MPTVIPTALNREMIVTLGSKLAPAAVILGRLRMLTQRAETDLEEVVNLIRLDPALTFHVSGALFTVSEPGSKVMA